MIGHPLDFMGRGRLPVFVQTEATECGLACLAMVAFYHGYRTDVAALRRQHPVSLKGATLRGLMAVAEQMQLSCRPLRYEMGHLRQLRLPAIVHWDMNHFVVLKSVSPRGIVVHDPAFGARSYTLAEASKHLTGIALELQPAEGFVRREERVRLPISAFWGQMPELAGPLLQVFALSIVLELLVIGAPFYMQLTMDEVVARGDVSLLPVLAVGFGILAVISVAATTLRGVIVLVLQNALHFRMGARLFHHLVRLPLAYFEKRHIGDLLSRFGSIQPIQAALAEDLIISVIDGFMAAATLMMIFIYSWRLALIVLGAALLYAALRLGLYVGFRERSRAVIEAEAKEHSIFIETARAIQAVKLFNREADRESQWLNRYAEVVHSNIRLGHLKVGFKTANDLIFGAENIVTIYLAAQLAIDGAMTVGMVFAFISYKQHFTQKVALLIEKLLTFRILELHLERLSDIALTQPEPGQDRPTLGVAPIEGRIELRDVCFRYAETERYVLDKVNLVVEAGRFVTIMGPSGGGKTTLLKVMLGLLEPTSGEVLIDGIPLRAIGPRAYREQVAAVMQDDQLLSGSIADNITFFDPHLDADRMALCAQMAGVHDEILAMPMGYNSLIGDMGSSLSGGQKQRVLLARALYKTPKILFLDEGTAHLDVETERRINERLRRLNMTRISVAHRPEMMTGADEILRLGSG
ncbi:MAG TPA: peptidase domain-containing ABC transporter [Crenalkalicoccus sp.]|jgi:ATP-binding cassette subfamily B protein RaxB|nr:peptidase domain-containing ABC transporter [Crenalkalicoccus sp.]